MSRTMTLNVRISGPLCEFIAANVGEEGTYENIAEYVRDLIRRDRARVEGETLERLRLELPRGIAALGASRHPGGDELRSGAGRRRVAHAET